MSDLEVLVAFRKAEAASTIHKFTKTVNNCQDSYCSECPAQQACRQLVNDSKDRDFYTGYKDWAKRTPFLSLSELQQQYPELFL